MKRGFTLIEVLIALSVFAMSVLGIYSILNSSIRMSTHGRDKLLVIDKGYERILKHLYYPRLSLTSEEEDGELIRYTYSRESTVIPTVVQVKLRVESDFSVVTYEYFEHNR